MEIEIPKQLYEWVLMQSAQTGLSVEEIVEQVFRNFMERGGYNPRE